MKIPVTYVIVPETRMRVIRVDFHPSNKRKLVQDVRHKKVVGLEIYPCHINRRVLWSKARVQRHFVRV